MSEYNSSMDFPSSRWMVSKAMSEGYEGTLSHSRCSSTMLLGDRMSGRMDSACPSLMKKGPRDVMDSRSTRTRFTSASGSSIFPARASFRTQPRYPDRAEKTCPTLRAATRGRGRKNALRPAGSYSVARPPVSPTSDRRISRPAAAESSSLMLRPRRASIIRRVSSSSIICSRMELICSDISRTSPRREREDVLGSSRVERRELEEREAEAAAAAAAAAERASDGTAVKAKAETGPDARKRRKPKPSGVRRRPCP
mmetsp:Transcript_15547/g.34955  ORF Transcript_15547/g.34955 Transcript_15547/m.34955 type:complete len:255 (-) Transcript_15547:209-973(-)